jgi:hypothetical protein
MVDLSHGSLGTSFGMYVLLGAGGGLIAASWQGFKDPPWEGFSIYKFVRSPLVGALAGAAGWWLEQTGAIDPIDNLGLFMLACLATERLASETYKGFLRRQFHPEYFKLFERSGFPIHHYAARAALGLLFFVLGLRLYQALGSLAGLVLDRFGATPLSGIIIGTVTGLVVASGGALKDSQFEGFKPKKFIRSPFITAIGAIPLVLVSSHPLLIALGSIGFERVGVEFYKTFLTRQIRGIHSGKSIVFPDWFERRWLFFVSYGCCVVFCGALMFWI